MLRARRPVNAFWRAAGWLASLPRTVLFVAFGVPALLLAAVDWAFLTLEPGEVFTGYYRQDFVYYSGNARAVVENGNGLFYGDPASSSLTTPRVHSHLQLLLLGWIFGVTGISLPVLWQVGQLVFGVAMFLALYPLVGCFFPARQRSFAYLLIALGAGGAWIQALGLSIIEPGGWLQHLERITDERVTRGLGWFPNVFQTAIYTTESFYHALVFATFALALQGRMRLALLGTGLIWWSHPFTGVEAALVLGVFASLEWLLGSRRHARLAGGVLAISLLFLAHYLVVVPYFSVEAADVAARWRTAEYFLRAEVMFVMWGIFLLWPLFFLRRKLVPLDLSEASDRFLAVWLVVVAALVLHDKLLPDGVNAFQPMHFTHGYLYLPMAMLTLRGFVRLSRAWRPRPRRVAAVLLLAVASFDNAVFVANTLRSEERVILRPEANAILRFLQAQEEPAIVLELAREPGLRQMIPVMTPHHVYLSNAFQTPFYGRKLQAVTSLAESPEPARGLARRGISWVAGPASTLRFLDDDLEQGRARLRLSSGRLRLIEILIPPTPQEPGEERRLQRWRPSSQKVL